MSDYLHHDLVPRLARQLYNDQMALEAERALADELAAATESALLIIRAEAASEATFERTYEFEQLLARYRKARQR